MYCLTHLISIATSSVSVLILSKISISLGAGGGDRSGSFCLGRNTGCFVVPHGAWYY
jgi:hypothetical protein